MDSCKRKWLACRENIAKRFLRMYGIKGKSRANRWKKAQFAEKKHYNHLVETWDICTSKQYLLTNFGIDTRLFSGKKVLEVGGSGLD
jgi:methyl coenzyme M reductase gamma subunit